MVFITVASATLPSVPLDFKGNLSRILESIRVAKAQGATLRTGPELEVPGYGCLDHHLEADTFFHSWEVVAEILNDPICKDMLVDVGMGVRHRVSTELFHFRPVLMPGVRTYDTTVESCSHTKKSSSFGPR